MAVRFYGADYDRITEEARPLVKGIVEKIPPQSKGSPLDLDSVGEKLTINGETYIQVIFPIDNGMGVKVGYLDGVYHAPSEIVAEIRHQSFYSIILVVLTVFMTSLVMYPIIIRLNRKLLAYSNTLALTNVGMLKVLGSAIAKRDSDTNIHNYRVALYSVRLGEKLGDLGHRHARADQGGPSCTMSARLPSAIRFCSNRES